MEVFIFARLHAAPGKLGAVREAMWRIQGPTREEPGCLAYGAFKSLRDPDEFYIQTRWKDLRAFEAHVELPHTVRFVAEVEPLLDHPFNVTVAEKIW